MAYIIIDKKLVPSFDTLVGQMSLIESESEPLLCDLLIKSNFDVSKVEYALFSMIGHVGRDLSIDLDSNEKEENYQTSHAPVETLKKEIEELEVLRKSLKNPESNEYRELELNINKKKYAQQQAIKDCASNIFYLNNSAGNMGTELPDGTVKIDLHCLNIEAAKKMIDTLVKPTIKTVTRFMIITGRGNHSANGKSDLKDAMKNYIQENNYRLEQVDGNPGAFYVYE